MIRIKQFVFNNFGVNTYLLIDEATRDAAVVDPAMASQGEYRIFDTYVADSGIHLTRIINTHLHLDHCFGLNYVKDKYGVSVMAHPADALLGQHMAEQCRRFGMRWQGGPVLIDTPLADGDTVEIGQSSQHVIHVPGHSPGSIALYLPDEKLLLSGDTLFRGSVGRTDLEGGSQSRLLESVRTRLYTLPDDVSVFPGHDRPTTIGTEKKYNPFV